MGRLIDADELLRRWDELPNRSRIEFDQVIMLMPIAYDVDKVVEQLEELTMEECTLHECGIRSEYCKPCIAKKAIEIVKAGGIINE